MDPTETFLEVGTGSSHSNERNCALYLFILCIYIIYHVYAMIISVTTLHVVVTVIILTALYYVCLVSYSYYGGRLAVTCTYSNACPM